MSIENHKWPKEYKKKYGWQTLPSLIATIFVALTKGNEYYWVTLLLGYLIYTSMWAYSYSKHIENKKDNIAFNKSVFINQSGFIVLCLIYIFYL